VLVAAQEAGKKWGGGSGDRGFSLWDRNNPKVNVITGPGNIYVTLAKKLVYGTVGIDSCRAFEEVLVIGG